MLSGKILKFAAFTACLSVSAAQYQNQTGPFSLKISSANKTIDGSYLFSCHSGAAIEQLCLGNQTRRADDYATYYFNYSTSSSTMVDGSYIGVLIYNMPYQINNTTAHESEPLNFYYNPTSNVADLLFEPGNYQTVPVGFNSNGNLFLTNYVDDTVSPPNGAGGFKAYYHWYVCQTYYQGYTYPALAWVTVGPPVNPSCQAVNVTKEAIGPN